MKKELTDLTEEEFLVMKQNKTEPPFKNAYWDHFEEGIYVDKLSGVPLFSSKHKFQSDCGWPSFSKPINKNNVKRKKDFSNGMIRTEIKSISSDSHLGHVFLDGPIKQGKTRYCMNSAALEFIPKNQMKEQGYEEYLPFV